MEKGPGASSNGGIHRPASPSPTTPAAITRRQALKLGAATTLAAGLVRVGTAAAGPPSYLVRSSYAGLTGRAFTVGGRSLVLASVADPSSARAAEGWTAGDDDVFALGFAGAVGLGAQIHELHHPALGRFQLYVGPVGAPRGGEQSYEALIDRSVKVRGDKPAPAVRDPAPAVATGGEPTLAQEHAAYAALAERIAEKEDGVDAADITPSPDQVRELRRTRGCATGTRPAKRRRRPRKPVGRRRRRPRRAVRRAKRG